MTIAEFLRQVETIVKLNPSYALGHTGADGECDCIGLIIGAVERNGISWHGIHGSNWWARNYTDALQRLPSASVLSAGDLVYKARAPGANGYDLPSRYSNHPDRLDYYHVGIVTATNPLEITHCTSGGGVDGITRDTRMGNWTHYGKLSLIEGEESGMEMQTATVYAENGRPVNLRRTPSSSGALVDRIAVGTLVSVESIADGWAKITAADRGGYMSMDFLRLSGDNVPAAPLEQRVDELTRTVASLAERVAALEGGG